MDKSYKNTKSIKKISSHVFSRSLSLLNLSLTTGAKYASLKIGDFLTSSQDREERLQKFFLSQTAVLVEELGKLKGSIMKAGQMLSIYGEHLFPPQVNDILKTLQTSSRPVAWEEMRKVIKQQLGDQKFALLDIDPEPIAAASMGQVYKAVILATKEVLALKVQYPGVEKAIESDLKSLKTILSLSHLLPSHSGFEDIFKEIRMMLHFETDYLRELSLLNQYRTWLAEDKRFILPKVYEEFSTKRLLALSYEEGFSIDSEEVKQLSDLQRNRLGAGFLDLLFKEIFLWKTVQTDPHFGNYKIRLDGQGEHIVLLDFGAVRQFPANYIDPFRALVRSSLEHKKEPIIKAGMKMGFLRETDSPEMLELFSHMCFTAIEPFEEVYASEGLDGSSLSGPYYEWGQSDLFKRLSELVKDAAFTFKLRSPPREAIFLDRKLLGIFIILTKLNVKMGPRNLLKSFL